MQADLHSVMQAHGHGVRAARGSLRDIRQPRQEIEEWTAASCLRDGDQIQSIADRVRHAAHRAGHHDPAGLGDLQEVDQQPRGLARGLEAQDTARAAQGGELRQQLGGPPLPQGAGEAAVEPGLGDRVEVRHTQPFEERLDTRRPEPACLQEWRQSGGMGRDRPDVRLHRAAGQVLGDERRERRADTRDLPQPIRGRELVEGRRRAGHGPRGAPIRAQSMASLASHLEAAGNLLEPSSNLEIRGPTHQLTVADYSDRHGGG
jgi:hypothetical protein